MCVVQIILESSFVFRVRLLAVFICRWRFGARVFCLPACRAVLLYLWPLTRARFPVTNRRCLLFGARTTVRYIAERSKVVRPDVSCVPMWSLHEYALTINRVYIDVNPCNIRIILLVGKCHYSPESDVHTLRGPTARVYVYLHLVTPGTFLCSKGIRIVPTSQSV